MHQHTIWLHLSTSDKVAIQGLRTSGNQRNISSGENSDINITASASTLNSSSSAMEEAIQSLFNIPLNIIGGFTEKIETTLHGSARDIGWLQGACKASCQDGTERFMELLAMSRKGAYRLPDNLVYFLVPGPFSNLSPLYFDETKNFLSMQGLACRIAKIHSEASVKTNAWELKGQIENLYSEYGKKVLVLGHSKGGLDAAAAMAIYWSNLKNKVAGLALVQSPYGGTPIASDILGDGHIFQNWRKIFWELIIVQFMKGDSRALEDLTYSKRREFLSQYTLSRDLPVISFHTEARADPQALFKLSHFADVEFPSIITPCSNQTAKVRILFPIATVLGASASYLEHRYGEKSDGLVTRKDAEVPGSVLVRPDTKMDHSRMVYPCVTCDADKPNAPQVCEALLALLVEIGKEKSKSHKNA